MANIMNGRQFSLFANYFDGGCKSPWVRMQMALQTKELNVPVKFSERKISRSWPESVSCERVQRLAERKRSCLADDASGAALQGHGGKICGAWREWILERTGFFSCWRKFEEERGWWYDLEVKAMGFMRIEGDRSDSSRLEYVDYSKGTIPKLEQNWQRNNLTELKLTILVS